MSERSALVTGASRGIGRGIALSLARQGFGLTITSRTESDLEKLAEELVERGAARVVYRTADMADRDSLTDLVALHDITFGSMNALVLNAGVGAGGTVVAIDLDKVDTTMRINFSACFAVLQASLPLLRRGAAKDPSHGSRVIGLASIRGIYTRSGIAAYAASKAALISLLETVNHEETRHGVSATAIAPGYVETDMTMFITDKIPADTMIRVDDVVRVVDMLLGLSGNATINTLVLERSSSGGYSA